jgi:uracil-DNA glycosylase
MSFKIHPSWQTVLSNEFEKLYWKELISFVEAEYLQNICFPQKENILRAFDITPFDSVKVVILGQDPYHTPDIATGLCFSVPEGIKVPPSVKNILKELRSDMDVSRTETNLTDWAEQGVLLLNCVLTVRTHTAGSHYGK